MVTIGTAFEELVDELESMLDMVSESLDLMEKDKKDEAMRVLADLEEAMLDFLDYEEVEEEPEVVEVPKKDEGKQQGSKKPSPKKSASKKK